MAPSAVDEPKQTGPSDRKISQPKLLPVKETRFEAYIEPQSDGYKKALEQPDKAAIVIDNGWSWSRWNSAYMILQEDDTWRGSARERTAIAANTIMAS